MPKALAVVSLIAVTLVSCATAPKQVPESQVRFEEASSLLTSMQDEFRAVYGDVGDVMERIAVLYAHPGWVEMEQIIRSSTANTDTSSEDIALKPDTGEALDRWTDKWGESGEDKYLEYLNLVEQCTFLEVRRLALRMKLRSVEIKLVHALATETASGRGSQHWGIEKALDELEDLEKQINAYTINDLGLYEPAVSASL